MKKNVPFLFHLIEESNEISFEVNFDETHVKKHYQMFN